MAKNDLEYKLTLKDDATTTLKRVDAAAGKTDKSIKGVGKTSNSLGASLGSVKGPAMAAAAGIIAVGAAAVKLTSSVIKAASEMETLNVQFKVILGSATAAEKRMKSLADQAAKTPFKLTQYANASRVLQTLTQGALATQTGLELVGDAAASTGTELQNLSMHIGRVYDGLKNNRPVGESMMRLQELGLVSGALRGKLEELQKKGLGQQAWTLFETNLRRYKGGMEALSQTADGLASTLSDNWDRALRSISDATGALDSWKSSLSGAIELLNAMEKYKAFDRMARSLDKVYLVAVKLNPSLMGLQVIYDKILGTVKDADAALEHETDSTKRLVLINEALVSKSQELLKLKEKHKEQDNSAFYFDTSADQANRKQELQSINNRIALLKQERALEQNRLQKQSALGTDAPTKPGSISTGPSKAEQRAAQQRLKSLEGLTKHFEAIHGITKANADQVSLIMLSGSEREKTILEQKLNDEYAKIKEHENAVLNNKYASDGLKAQATTAANTAAIEAKLVYDEQIHAIDAESQRKEAEQRNIAAQQKRAALDAEAEQDKARAKEVADAKRGFAMDTYRSATGFAKGILDYKKQALRQEEEALRAQGLSEKQIDAKMLKEKAKVARAEKAMTITKIAIDTALGATRAYNAYQGIAGVGPVLGAIAAAAVVANGAAQIAVVSSKKYAGGGITEGERSGDKQSVNVNGGEMITNERQQNNNRALIGQATGTNLQTSEDLFNLLDRPSVTNNNTNTRNVTLNVTVNGGGGDAVDQIKEAIHNGEFDLEEYASAI